MIATKFTCLPRRVNVESGASVLLVLDIGESMSATGVSKPEVRFQ